MTFLHCDIGHLACVKLLLQEGADIEQRNVVSFIRQAGIFPTVSTESLSGCS